MCNQKELILQLSSSFCNEINEAYEKNNIKSSEFIDDNVILYIEEKKYLSYIEKMKQGYIAMKDLNLEISEFGLENDLYDLIEYEAKL